MAAVQRNAIIFSASSDIGAAMAVRWKGAGWRVFGTYRTTSEAVSRLNADGIATQHCDLSDAGSVRRACEQLRAACPVWDALVLCPGSIEPIGLFPDVDFDAWEQSVTSNFTAQLRVVHELLPTRRRGSEPLPCVLFFAGGGTNSAPVHFSAYTISKIAMIKMCELLDAEVPDARFAIVGPGWVRTKIHEATVRAGEAGGDNYRRTVQMLASEEGWTPMSKVLDCCDWVTAAPKAVIGGRNFSVAFDPWGTDELAGRLMGDPHMYKLRRAGNDKSGRGG